MNDDGLQEFNKFLDGVINDETPFVTPARILTMEKADKALAKIEQHVDKMASAGINVGDKRAEVRASRDKIKQFLRVYGNG